MMLLLLRCNWVASLSLGCAPPQVRSPSCWRSSLAVLLGKHAKGSFPRSATASGSGWHACGGSIGPAFRGGALVSARQSDFVSAAAIPNLCTRREAQTWYRLRWAARMLARVRDGRWALLSMRRLAYDHGMPSHPIPSLPARSQTRVKKRDPPSRGMGIAHAEGESAEVLASRRHWYEADRKMKRWREKGRGS